MLPPKSAVCSDPGPPLSSEGVVGATQSVPAIEDSGQGAAEPAVISLQSCQLFINVPVKPPVDYHVSGGRLQVCSGSLPSYRARSTANS